MRILLLPDFDPFAELPEAARPGTGGAPMFPGLDKQVAPPRLDPYSSCFPGFAALTRGYPYAAPLGLDILTP
jgi:hypothetical protein